MRSSCAWTWEQQQPRFPVLLAGDASAPPSARMSLKIVRPPRTNSRNAGNYGIRGMAQTASAGGDVAAENSACTIRVRSPIHRRRSSLIISLKKIGCPTAPQEVVMF